MRILHVSMLYPPHIIGGAEKSVAALAEAQARAGHQVAAACTTPGTFITEQREGVSVYRMPHETLFWAEDWPKHNGIERLARKAMIPFNRGLRRHFRRVLDDFRPDIVHTHSMVDVSTSLWPYAAGLGYPVVHTLRDYDLLCVDGSMYHGGKGCGAKCRLISMPKQRHHHAINAVVAISQEAMRIHRDRGLFAHVPDTRRRTIWNSARVSGVDENYRRPDRSGQPLTFGFIGRVNDEKGVGVLIEAARGLSGDTPWSVLIAGSSPTGIDQYEAAAAGLPIRFGGYMDARDFFEQIDVLVVPSIWAEPFGRIVIEAYSMGVPVIGSAVGGIPDLVVGDRDLWLSPAGDVAALTGRMQRVLRAGRSELPAPECFVDILQQTSPEAIVMAYDGLYAAVMDINGKPAR